MSLSVLILTKNEEQDLPGCLESVSWSDDIHVLDSFSNDRTVEIAELVGARVVQRTFDGYASQRNFGLHGIEYKYDWVLILDADERITDCLAREVFSFIESDQSEISACRMRRRDFFFGTWLKNSQISPFYIRLVRPGRVHYEREINEVLVVDGHVKDLSQPFDHFPFSKGIRHWIDKHNVYSSMEAKHIIQTLGKTDPSWKVALFGSDFNERRFHQKQIFYKLPFRPLVKFIYMFVFRRAFLDGKAGITYAFLQAIYEYFIVIKTRELKFRKRGEMF